MVTKQHLQSRFGLTVTELLVSVSLLAILLALLLPVGTKVRERSNTGKCVNNLRNIGVALHTYIAEHNGFYPPGRDNPPPDNQFLYVTLKRAGIETYTNKGETRRDAGIWYCPSDKDRLDVHSAKSYGVNQYLGAQIHSADTPAWKRKPIAAVNQSRLMYLVDHDSGQKPKSTGGNLSASSWPLRKPTSLNNPPASGTQFEFRHEGKVNALFVDGHVRTMTYQELAGTGDYHIVGDK